MKKAISAIIAVAMSMVMLAGCSTSSSSDTKKDTLQSSEATEKDDSKDPIYFAWYGPMTGDSKQYGDTEKVAVEIALDKINNEMGGVLGGREIVVDFYDDKNDAKEAVTIANKVVGEEKYLAAIGGFGSTPTMAAAPIYEEAKIINYSPTASHANYSALGEYMFRNTPTQSLETAAYAEYVYDKLGVRSVCILNVNDDWGNNIAKYLQKYLKVREERY